MSSGALERLLSGIEEVKDLQAANPTPVGGLTARSSVVRAINRSSVVLLTSHLERYVRALNEEAVDEVNAASVTRGVLTELLRLQHSRSAVESMIETQWDRRGPQLANFSAHDAWLWGEAVKGELKAERLLDWMRSPLPERIEKFFAMWGVGDIFGAITRTKRTRDRLWTRLLELVDKRNRIAHGDPATEATYQEVASYLSVVKDFCVRADRVMARVVSEQLDRPVPW